MYELFNQISSRLIGPIMDVAYGVEHLPLLFAFFLGVVGALAPCQLTSNISAITIYGNKSLVDKVPWLHVLLFVLGKILVYSVLGIIIWLLGKEVYSTLSQIMPMIRKAIGIVLIVNGLFIVGYVKWIITGRIFDFPTKVFNNIYLVSIFLAVSLTLSFCFSAFVLYLLNV